MTLTDAPPPEQLGPYRIGALLGAGGMGRVYRAERIDGVFDHTIAVKLMKRPRLPAHEVAEQFARERQILARLQHRNIAQLLDGGITPEGVSYFMMELIVGRPIQQYVKEERPDTRSLLMLFRQLCTALQHAHAQLVVHADIKPNNILVTSDGTIKLLDFGVARMIADAGDPGGPSPEVLGITHFYASPARRRGELPGTSDDIFSLGVLLSELLGLHGRVPRELRSICRCAAAEDPANRYPSVDAMKADIERWLNGFPVHAHGLAWRYVTRKFLARHRLAVSAAAASVVLLAGSATALGVLFVRAEHARAEAEQRFNEVRDLSRYVLFDAYDSLESVPRALRFRHDLAVKGQRYLDGLSTDPDAPVAVRLEVAEGLRRLAALEGGASSPSLADIPRAKANLARAESIARALPADPKYARERALALTRIFLSRGTFLISIALDTEAAERALHGAESTLATVLAADPTDPEAHGLLLDLAVERAALLQWQGHYDESITLAREALSRQSTSPGAHWSGSAPEAPLDREAIRRRGRLLDILAESTYYGVSAAASEAVYREHYALLKDLTESDPRNLRDARAFMRAGWALGSTLVALGAQKAPEAHTILTESLAQADALITLEPDDQDLIRMRSVTAVAAGQALAALGRFPEAITLLENAVHQRETLWNEESADWAIARDVAAGWDMFGEVLLQARQNTRACQAFHRSQDIFTRMRSAGRLTKLDEDTTQTELRRLVATAGCKSRT